MNDLTPLATHLGRQVLSTEQKPRTSSFGMPVLLEKAAPFGGWLGVGALARDPDPLFQVPVLSKGRSLYCRDERS